MPKYDDMAEHYQDRRQDTSRFDFNRDIEVPAMISMLGNVTDKTILDLGCGFGDHASRLSNYKKLVGVDTSKELIQAAIAKKIPDTDFMQADIKKQLPFPHDSFDIVFASLVIHYISDLDALFKEVKRTLKEGGIFCFSTMHPIMNLLNQKDGKIAIEKEGSIHGNYFDESPQINDFGSLGKLKVHNYTFDTLLNTTLKYFTLTDYKDALPTPESKKYNAFKYKMTTTLPTFILFKATNQSH